jgi:putative inorganic carbon (HCO3(-)) transporter
VKRLRKSIEPLILELPRESFARWASIFFTLSVLCYLISIAASQAFLGAAGLVYAAGWVRHRSPILFPPFKWPVALFCLWTVFSTLLSSDPAVGGFAVRKLVLFLILLFAINVIRTLRHLEWIYRALFIEAAVASLLAILQFVREYRTVRAEHAHHVYLYLTYWRITGFMGDWMNFGGQQMLVMMMMAALLIFYRGRRYLWWTVAAVVLVAIVLNMTRGVWLGCFVGIIYLVAQWKPRLLWGIPVLMAVGYLLLPRVARDRVRSVLHPSRDPSIAMRFEMWGVGLRMIQKHLWFGVGPDTIPGVYDLYLPPGKSPAPGYHGHLHSDFVQFAAERGLPCLVIWLWLMSAIGWETLKLRRACSNGRWMIDGALAGWLAFMTEGFFEFNFGTSPVLMLYLFVAVTPFIVEQIERRQGNASPGARS